MSHVIKIPKIARRRRPVKRARSTHQHVPEYRGAPHVYAYCVTCGCAMKTHSQKLYDSVRRLEQLVKRQNEVTA